FQAQFRYSEAGANTGLNNYFTIRFDAETYRQNLRQQLAEQQQARMDSLQQLENQRNALSQKLAYFEQLQQGMPQADELLPDASTLEMQAEAMAREQLDQTRQQIQDSLLQSIPEDSLSGKLKPPSQPEVPEMSPEQRAEYARTKQKVQQLDRQIRQLQRFKNFDTDSLVQHGKVGAQLGHQSQTERVLNGLQKLEIGMCYPDHSDFLVARVPVQGINLAYQYDDYQVFFTHGTALQPQFTAREFVQNQFNPISNFSSLADFRNLDRGRRITAVKAGIGPQIGTHLYAGLLYGKGLVSYRDSAVSEQEKNYALELDARYQLTENQHLSLVWGRSHTQIQNPALTEVENNNRNALFDLSERTNALKAEYGLLIPKTRTRLTTNVRWVDPYFKSHGVGFLRTDNLRYQIRVDQSLGRKWKVGGFVSREEDNLLKLYDYTTSLVTYGLNAQYRPVRSLSLRADFRPMALTVDQTGEPLETANQNWVSTLSGTWMVRKEKRSLMLTGLYTRYQLQDQGGSFFYENTQVSALYSWNEKLQWEGSYTFFHTNDTVGLRHTHLAESRISWTKGRFETALVGKAAIVPKELQWGYGLNTSCRLWKGLSAQAGFEKLVLGETFFQVENPALQRFPYYSTGRLVWQW
ncbi:MAG: hypothetical protein ACFB10_10140, partial [Salibacteraceae bacterium]